MRRAQAALLAAMLLAWLPEAAAEPAPLTARVLDDAGHQLPLAGLHASLSRTLPAELGSLPGPDHDALRFLLIGPPDTSLEAIQALSLSAQGRPLDVIVSVRTEPANCPDGVAPELVCRQTPPLRLVGDELDRHHPAVKQRSLRAELGGVLRLSAGLHELVELPVAGPRQLAKLLPASGIVELTLRVLVLRSDKGGAPALGQSDAQARTLVQQELARTAAVWAQCGISLGTPTIRIVDPPATQLLSVGCGLGQPASGGELRLRHAGRHVALATRAGEAPVEVALRLAEALRVRGKAPVVFQNQRAQSEAVPTADLMLDASARWEPDPGAALSSDPSLPLCSSELNLDDGLTHFRNGDAFSGTLEERALLRSFDDGDPRSIEVLVVPELAGGERIGESFIVSPGSSLSNAVIVDRSALAAGARSFALGHELGHVLLAMPGHPDDFGVDQSWSLLDSDVADPTIFGPRRLSLADCERALTQSGPGGLTPLLEPVPVPRARLELGLERPDHDRQGQPGLRKRPAKPALAADGAGAGARLLQPAARAGDRVKTRELQQSSAP